MSSFFNGDFFILVRLFFRRRSLFRGVVPVLLKHVRSVDFFSFTDSRDKKKKIRRPVFAEPIFRKSRFKATFEAYFRFIFLKQFPVFLFAVVFVFRFPRKTEFAAVFYFKDAV